MLDLAAFYAARGITPEQIRQMSYADRAVLRVGRARWFEDDQPDCGRASAAHTHRRRDGTVAKKQVINTVLTVRDNMSGGLVKAAQNAKKSGKAIDSSMISRYAQRGGV